jgi:hypothetical protein
LLKFVASEQGHNAIGMARRFYVDANYSSMSDLTADERHVKRPGWQHVIDITPGAGEDP